MTAKTSNGNSNSNSNGNGNGNSKTGNCRFLRFAAE